MRARGRGRRVHHDHERGTGDRCDLILEAGHLRELLRTWHIVAGRQIPHDHDRAVDGRDE